MAFSVNTDGVRRSIGFVTFDGSWFGAAGFDAGAFVWFEWGYGSFSNITPAIDVTGQDSGTWSEHPSVTKDASAKVHAVGFASQPPTTKQGGNINFKTYADLAVFVSGLTPGIPTNTTCPVTGSFIPNTNESVANVSMQFRVKGTATWIDAGVVGANLTGTGTIALSGTIAGLNPGTDYEARFYASRTTENGVTLASPIGTFTTTASTAVVIGPPAMNVTIDMPAPLLVTGLVIAVPTIDGVAIDMPAPTLSVGIVRQITRIYLLSDRIERNYTVT